MLQQAELADSLGFHSLWTVEHHFLEEFSHCSNPEVLYGAIAARTENIRIGYGVRLAPKPYNHPVRSAESAAVLYDVANDYSRDIATVFRQVFEASGGQVHAFETFVTGETAFVVCYEVIGTTVLVATNLFRKEDGAWRLAHHQAGPCDLSPATFGEEPDESPMQ